MKNIILFSGILFFLLACKSSRQSAESQLTTHSSQNSVDWPGIYRGILPCADCEGILTTLRLKVDLTYDLSRQYLGKGEESFIQSGSFQWNSTGGSISLVSWEKEGISGEEKSKSEEQEHYQVGENQLLKLDREGKQISGTLAQRYILKKVNFDQDIREKYWKLIELNGKAIKVAPGQNREAHFILKIAGSRVKGHGGCNSFSGAYELPDGQKIRFSNLASTEMACMEVDYEGEFFKALGLTDNYSLKGDSLSLNKARMAPLARFVAVYFR